MFSLPRSRLLVGLPLLAVLLLTPAISTGQGAKKGGTSRPVTFKTADGVDLAGSFYSSGGKKRDAVVILLHDFDLKKGGDSTQEGWGDLAGALQANGYAVLSFDFRGFGQSKTVTKDVFWKQPINGPTHIRRKGTKVTDEVNHKDFQPGYVPYLVNDIAAAKAYLDRQNDKSPNNCNTSSVILIGAGEGATLGAMWMANECRRRRDKSLQPIPGVPPTLGEPESKDLAAGVWLSIGTTLGRRNVAKTVTTWVVEAGNENKIPMAFVFGKDDSAGDVIARSLYNSIKTNPKSKDFATTALHPVEKTKLTGHALLESALDTQAWIINTYLDDVMQKRGNREHVDRKTATSAYYYTARKSSRPLKLSMKPGDDAPLVDVATFLPR